MQILVILHYWFDIQVNVKFQLSVLEFSYPFKACTVCGYHSFPEGRVIFKVIHIWRSQLRANPQNIQLEGFILSLYRPGRSLYDQELSIWDGYILIRNISRAQNNGRSQENVLPNLLNDQPNRILKGQIDRPYFEREKNDFPI